MKYAPRLPERSEGMSCRGYTFVVEVFIKEFFSANSASENLGTFIPVTPEIAKFQDSRGACRMSG
jgi:hypothetical protein